MSSNGSNKSIDVTRLLDYKARQARPGRVDATGHRELRKFRLVIFARSEATTLLQPTALIHESYLRMVEQDMPKWQSRAHFFGNAAS